MFRRLDESPRLARLLERASAWLARRRGLPIVAGIALVALALLLRVLLMAAPSPALECAWALTLHGGVLIALLGIALAEPLGR
jgi:hypothetical protein